MKVFIVGLSRTGTTSLHLASIAAGFPSAHYPIDSGLRWLQGDFSARTFDPYQVFSDVPVAAFYRQIHAHNPDAKFVLTLRDEEAWLQSVEKHFRPTPPPSQYTIARDYFRLAVYGSLVFQRDRFLERYRLHNAAVREYFRDNPNFCVLNTESELNWRNFSAVLEIEPPNLPFPRATTPYIGDLARVDGQRLAKARSLVRKDLEAAVKSSL